MHGLKRQPLPTSPCRQGEETSTKLARNAAPVLVFRSTRRLLALPPEMQQAVAAAIGGNPMVASALLQVLGPHFAPLIQAAIVPAPRSSSVRPTRARSPMMAALVSSSPIDPA